MFEFLIKCCETSLGDVVILPLDRPVTFSGLKQYMTKLDKMGIKLFHLVCTFTIRCLFSFLIKCSETSLGVVVILPLDRLVTTNIFWLETSNT